MYNGMLDLFFPPYSFPSSLSLLLHLLQVRCVRHSSVTVSDDRLELVQVCGERGRKMREGVRVGGERGRRRLEEA